VEGEVVARQLGAAVLGGWSGCARRIEEAVLAVVCQTSSLHHFSSVKHPLASHSSFSFLWTVEEKAIC